MFPMFFFSFSDQKEQISNSLSERRFEIWGVWENVRGVSLNGSVLSIYRHTLFSKG